MPEIKPTEQTLDLNKKIPKIPPTVLFIIGGLLAILDLNFHVTNVGNLLSDFPVGWISLITIEAPFILFGAIIAVVIFYAKKKKFDFIYYWSLAYITISFLRLLMLLNN